MAQVLVSKVPRVDTVAARPVLVVESTGVLQVTGPTAIPVHGDAEGWIDLRVIEALRVVVTARGTGVTITAQTKATPNAPALAYTLADGVINAGTSEGVVDAAIRAGFIRFLQAGTAGASNEVDLFVMGK